MQSPSTDLKNSDVPTGFFFGVGSGKDPQDFVLCLDIKLSAMASSSMVEPGATVAVFGIAALIATTARTCSFDDLQQQPAHILLPQRNFGVNALVGAAQDPFARTPTYPTCSCRLNQRTRLSVAHAKLVERRDPPDRAALSLGCEILLFPLACHRSPSSGCSRILREPFASAAVPRASPRTLITQLAFQLLPSIISLSLCCPTRTDVFRTLLCRPSVVQLLSQGAP
uniref:Uncharacterized protein n=1 Tax=Mycena chlorophos TaxID=658473 RepID=A0ABQ0LCW1_MYCCL|nr:predicted protein [Mycena chlorophos]